MLGGMETSVSVIFEKAQHVLAPDEVQLAGLHGFNRQLVRRPGNHRVQSQNFPGFRDSYNQCFAFARGGREFGASLAQYEDSTGTLSLDQNHRVFRKNRGMFYLVESLNQVLGEVAEKIAGTQMAIKTALDATQAGHHGCSSISRQETGPATGGGQRWKAVNT